MSELSLDSRYLDLELEFDKFPLNQHPTPKPRDFAVVSAVSSQKKRPSPTLQVNMRPLLPENSRNFRSTVDNWLLRRELELQTRKDRKFLAEKSELSECTFRPKITKFPINLEISVDSRLYADSQRRLQSRQHVEKLKKELEQISDQSQPVKKFTLNAGALENRVQGILERRAEKIAKVRSEISSENPFRPKISDRSRAIAEASGRTTEPVEKRLLRDFRSRRISRSSSPDEQRSLRDIRPVSAGFIRRQEAFMQGRAKKLEIVDSEINRDCTFSPKISRKSRALSVGRGERNVDAVTQRLGVDYVHDLKRKFHEISVSSKPSFKPTITPMSTVLAVNARSLAPVHDRLYREALSRDKRIEATASEFARDSFADLDTSETPRLRTHNPKYEHISAVYDHTDPDKLSQTISDHISRREQKLQTLRAERETQELAECTFNPKIADAGFSTGTRTPRSARPVLVRGLDRFLELRRIAETQKVEEEERKRKVWHLDAMKKSPQNVITVPSPFNLSRSPKNQQKTFSFPGTPRRSLTPYRRGGTANWP